MLWTGGVLDAGVGAGPCCKLISLHGLHSSHVFEMGAFLCSEEIVTTDFRGRDAASKFPCTWKIHLDFVP